MTLTPKAGASLPKNGQAVIRAYRPGVELRAATDGGMPTLHGYFAVFDRFTEIDSYVEGHFMERIAQGAFLKTFREHKPKVLFQHGQDPQVGDKPLGPIEDLREDATGAAYEVPLLDTAYNRELIPGLEAGLYGASFRFKVMRHQTDENPEPSEHNPDGIPERTIKEARVFEFGPVTFPAYAEASAGVRSLTDRFLFDAVERDPAQARALIRMSDLSLHAEDLSTLAAQDDDGAVEEHDDQTGRSQKPRRTLHESTPSLASTSAESRRRSTDDTSDAQRRDSVNTTWPHVSREEFAELWIPRI